MGSEKMHGSRSPLAPDGSHNGVTDEQINARGRGGVIGRRGNLLGQWGNAQSCLWRKAKKTKCKEESFGESIG